MRPEKRVPDAETFAEREQARPLLAARFWRWVVAFAEPEQAPFLLVVRFWRSVTAFAEHEQVLSLPWVGCSWPAAVAAFAEDC